MEGLILGGSKPIMKVFRRRHMRFTAARMQPKEGFAVPGTVIGKIVGEEMAKRGWSQSEVARRAGLSQPAVREIIMGKTKNPRIDVILGLAKAFGVTPLYICGLQASFAAEARATGYPTGEMAGVQ